ncbi:hypothetical protein [Bradyrhizobium sp. Ec3.3]|uniref:hypothetical protein n=1 Tax=Bradyrhizobium sp. Ec3.3 TaxID=189753 RepID=UPI000489062F|nr:hypothetical protein [Bradyrhizobium sp. Ec3.3]
MKTAFLMAAIAAATVVGSNAGAAELPTFELTGFPITPHQVALIGGANLQEQSPTPTLTFGGMPASPVQIAILTPRHSMMANTMSPKATTIGVASK